MGLAVATTAGPLSERFLIVARNGTTSKIFVVRRDGRDWSRLTDLRGSEADAVFCPARGEVFYRRLERNNWDLYSWNLELRQEACIHRHLGLERQPQPSPDGRQLAFVSDRFGNNELLLLDLNSPQAAPRRLTQDQGENSSPDWSPDGKSLVFSSRRNGQSDLYRLELESLQEQRLTRTEDDEVDPKWSPDGRSILFQTVEGRYRQGRLGLLDLSLGKVTDLNELTGTDHQANWSPDGKSIIYLDYLSARQPASPQLMQFPLPHGPASPIVLQRRELELTHWSFRQASWNANWPDSAP